MVEGTINTWNKQEGESVAKGDEVFEMESDKIVNAWDAPVAGVLRRIVAKEGDALPVGALLGIIASSEVDDADIDAFIASYSGATPEPPAAEASGAAASTSRDAATRSSPAVRKLAQALDVDLNQVIGTGRRGRITDDDVRAAASVGATVASDGPEVIPLSTTRKTIAKRLTQAKQEIPHFYLSVEYTLDALLAHRDTLNAGAERKNVSINDLLVWCVARALMQEPRVNINVVDDSIYQFKNANVAVAIATDEALYPVTVRNAQEKSPAEIATCIAALAAKAKLGNLSKEDISGGSFTVSNMGMFGVTHFTAIINPPMGAILALGEAAQKIVVRDGVPTVATVVSATLSCDHRVIDGVVGAKFLQALGAEISSL